MKIQFVVFYMDTCCYKEIIKNSGSLKICSRFNPNSDFAFISEISLHIPDHVTGPRPQEKMLSFSVFKMFHEISRYPRLGSKTGLVVVFFTSGTRQSSKFWLPDL